MSDTDLFEAGRHAVAVQEHGEHPNPKKPSRELPDWAGNVLSRLLDARWELIRPDHMGGPDLRAAHAYIREAEDELDKGLTRGDT